MLIIAALVAVQEMAARLGAYSGEGLMSLVREEFSLRIGAFVVVCLLVANLGLVVSEFAGIGAAMEIFGVSRYISVPIGRRRDPRRSCCSAPTTGPSGSSSRLSLVFLAYPIAMFLAGPDWGEVGEDTFIPHFIGDRDFLLLAVALVGTTITPYMQLYQAAAVADRGIGPEEYRHERIDAIVGSLFAGFVFLPSSSRRPRRSAGGAARRRRSRRRRRSNRSRAPSAEFLFAVGLLGASMLAAAIVPLSTAYGLAEAVGAERSVSHRFREAPLFLGLFALQVVIGALVALIPVNLIDLLVSMQVLNGFITPVILVFLFILTNRPSAVGEAVNGPRFKVFALVCVVVVSVLAFAALGVTCTVRRWFERRQFDEAPAGRRSARCACRGPWRDERFELVAAERERGVGSRRVDREDHRLHQAVAADDRRAGIADDEAGREPDDRRAGCVLDSVMSVRGVSIRRATRAGVARAAGPRWGGRAPRRRSRAAPSERERRERGTVDRAARRRRGERRTRRHVRELSTIAVVDLGRATRPRPRARW